MGEGISVGVAVSVAACEGCGRSVSLGLTSNMVGLGDPSGWTGVKSTTLDPSEFCQVMNRYPPPISNDAANNITMPYFIKGLLTNAVIISLNILEWPAGLRL
jgi:hypothetical protein